MKTMQKGFTLIELMIVIAIIGILAAIALPAYQDYVARSQATEGMKATSGLQSDIGAFYADQNTWPDSSTTAGAAILKGAQDLEGKYFPAKAVTVSGSPSVITTTFGSGANKGKTLTLTAVPSAAGGQIARWDCGGTIEAKRLPTSCQGAAKAATPAPANP